MPSEIFDKLKKWDGWIVDEYFWSQLTHSFLQDVEQLPEKIGYTEWEADSVKTLIKHGFLKMKVMWGNHKSFITKKFKKAIMKRWALKKRANISNNPEIKKSILKNKETVLLI